MVSLRRVLSLYFSVWLKIFIIESWDIETRVTTSFTLGGRLSESLGLLGFTDLYLPIVRKKGVYVRNSTLPTADPELSIFING